jgi:hypothetical protein
MKMAVSPRSADLCTPERARWNTDLRTRHRFVNTQNTQIVPSHFFLPDLKSSIFRPLKKISSPGAIADIPSAKHSQTIIWRHGLDIRIAASIVLAQPKALTHLPDIDSRALAHPYLLPEDNPAFRHPRLMPTAKQDRPYTPIITAITANGAHNGASTQTHDQSMTPHSFRAMNKRASKAKNVPPVSLILT